MALTGATGFLVSYGYSYTGSPQVADLTKENETQTSRYELQFADDLWFNGLIYDDNRMVNVKKYGFSNADEKNLFYMVFANSLLFTLIHIYRKFYLKEDKIEVL